MLFGTSQNKQKHIGKALENKKGGKMPPGLVFK
jgi:hypothetical protein